MNNFFIINFLFFTLLFYPLNIQKSTLENNIFNLYKTINDSNINFEGFKYAIHGYQYLLEKNLLKNNFLVIIDFTKPSYDDRFYLIDLNMCRLLLKTKVAHGKNSGDIFPIYFSNIPESNMSSIGFFITKEDYNGKHGYSLRLEGIETGINDNAKKRGIVIHGAEYVSDEYIKKYGRIGRSNGCLAIPEDINETLIKTIKEGTCVFVYYPDKNYISKSKIILNK